MSFVDDDEISISSLNSDVNEETLDKDLKNPFSSGSVLL